MHEKSIGYRKCNYFLHIQNIILRTGAGEVAFNTLNTKNEVAFSVFNTFYMEMPTAFCISNGLFANMPAAYSHPIDFS